MTDLTSEFLGHRRSPVGFNFTGLGKKRIRKKGVTIVVGRISTSGFGILLVTEEKVWSMG